MKISISLVSASSFLAYGICMILPPDSGIRSGFSPGRFVLFLFTSNQGVIRDFTTELSFRKFYLYIGPFFEFFLLLRCLHIDGHWNLNTLPKHMKFYISGDDNTSCLVFFGHLKEQNCT
ncbi:uncharacterized protein TrAFT101_004919 [Trichoderma asperellum]|uniref:uncharacterized protein n=1 Tax=Trichoderma asperellum TaxID=101201 RepID=UPI0033337378|nr:hypothetical protein TrAFT101_004919 [Trichoderma asperellum]